ncbi:hypothetical protein OHJ21_19285 [Virgibacillus sp. LDC1]|nr:hypothetical protein [Virgibacillus sp. LDC1]
MTDQIEELKKIFKSAIAGPSWVVDVYFKPFIERLEAAEAQVRQQKTARPIDEWHEDIGDVLWWAFPIEEAPYCGNPLDSEWPGYHTHWTPIVVPINLPGEE